MSKIIDLLSLLLVLPIICNAQEIHERPEPDCVTPDDQLGSCVDVRHCVSIMTALMNGDHLTNPLIAKFLRESQCGIAANSQKVCCHIDRIDFGETPTSAIPPSNSSPPPILPPPILPPPVLPQPSIPSYNEQQSKISDDEKCGKLEQHEVPSKWIAEIWYKHNKLGRSVYESNCLGTVVTLKHVIVPAHCVASLPAHVTLDHVTIQNDEYLVGKVYVHGSYNQPMLANDIAIIELDVELSQSRNPKASAPQHINNAVCLDLSKTNFQRSRSSIAFMKTEQGALKQGKILYMPNNQCSMYFDNQFTDLASSQFCANILSNETDISSFIGAILMTYDSTRQQYSLKGFTLTVFNAGQSYDESKPYVFIDIEQYLKWIQAALNVIPSLSSGISDQTSNYNKNPDDNVLDELRECQLATEKGRCVIEDYCTIYTTGASQSSRLNDLLQTSAKCSTGHNQNHDDGVCCPEFFVNQSALAAVALDVRFKEDPEDIQARGIAMLDMNQCGQVDATRRIVGGRIADLKEFPWFALLKYKVGRVDKFTCGGSLISSRYVLTCAHCITKLPAGYKVAAVRLGEYDLTTNPDCRSTDLEGENECNPPVLDVDIEELIPHPEYNKPRYSNDIGLVRMAQNVEFKRGVIIPICLPINNDMQQTLSNLSTVAGFGFTEHGRDSNVILKILVPKVPIETCQSFHRTSIQLSEKHACYGGQGIIDSCKGDSGSPLLNYAIINGKLKAIQMGIVASGHSECGRGVTGFPGIYTDVPKYMDWILENLY